MLNQLIARYVATTLAPLHGPIISRLSGLVKTLETDAYTKGKVSRFPIALDDEANPCARSGRSFPDLVPDKGERLIVYIEEVSPIKALNEGRGLWQSDLRLVAWGNRELFKVEGNKSADVVAFLMAKINQLLIKSVHRPAAPISSIEITIKGFAENSTLFSRYTYSEIRSQHLLSPYFSFGIEFSVKFTLDYNCLDTLIGLPINDCS